MFIVKATNIATSEITETEFATMAACEAHRATLDPSLYNTEVMSKEKRFPSISPRQIETALFLNGITSEMVEAAIMTLPSPDKELGLIAWRKSGSFERDEAAVGLIGNILNLTEQQLDSMWAAGFLL